MRLTTYTLHVPEHAMRGDAHALDAAKLVPDGFSWPAFAFSVLWFAYHRLWLAGLAVLALLVGLGLAGQALGLPVAAAFVVSLLASVLIGYEAASLRRWTYGRGGRPARDAVLAASVDEAEAKATARWLSTDENRRSVSTQSASTQAPARRADTAVIGLFPFGEGGR